MSFPGKQAWMDVPVLEWGPALQLQHAKVVQGVAGV